jgi:diguanylate cyclase (GGDEF)-like protein
VLAATALSGTSHVFGLQAERRADAVLQQMEEARRLLAALQDGETALRGAIAYDLPGLVDDAGRANDRLGAAALRAIIAEIDRDVAEEGGTPVAQLVAETIESRGNAVRRLRAGEREAMAESGRQGTGMRRSTQIRGAIESFLAARAERFGALGAVAARWRALGMLSALGGALGALFAIGLALARHARTRRATAQRHDSLVRRSEEVGALLAMNEILQACDTAADVERVVIHAAATVMPDAPAALQVFGAAPGATLAGAECWALKRSKIHACGAGGDLACPHAGAAGGGLCVPVAARGEVHGLLRISGGDPDGMARRRALASALADGASLALANIGLRETLRAQALRDPLTGLHNRRFIEETAGRLADDARRRGAPLAAAMIDVDHFKRLNDTHGHDAGDAALRSLAATLRAELRGSDLVSRHGGEEFLALLPDCDLPQALARMETLRRRVAGQSDGRAPAMTVSIGVAALPDCTMDLAALLRLADDALYAAKQGGRDRVAAAPRLSGPEETRPVLRVVETASA